MFFVAIPLGLFITIVVVKGIFSGINGFMEGTEEAKAQNYLENHPNKDVLDDIINDVSTTHNVEKDPAYGGDLTPDTKMIKDERKQ